MPVPDLARRAWIAERRCQVHGRTTRSTDSPIRAGERGRAGESVSCEDYRMTAAAPDAAIEVVVDTAAA
jgi:hypothetical protein